MSERLRQAGTAASAGLLDPKSSTAALLVANPNFYLTVTSRLSQMGWAIPADISVVSRADDSFLTFLVPQPARYTIHPHVFGPRLLRPVLEPLDSGAVTNRLITIMPASVRGEFSVRHARRWVT